MTFADVDGDGDADVAAGTALLRNDGGTLAPRARPAPSVGDVDGDGDVDIVTPTRVLLGDGETVAYRRRARPTRRPTWPAAGHPRRRRRDAWRSTAQSGASPVPGDADADPARRTRARARHPRWRPILVDRSARASAACAPNGLALRVACPTAVHACAPT